MSNMNTEKLLINKRRNSNLITGKINKNYDLQNGTETYSVNNSCEIIGDDIYFNSCVKINMKAKNSMKLIKKIMTDNMAPIFKKYRESIFEFKEFKKICDNIGIQLNEDDVKKYLKNAKLDVCEQIEIMNYFLENR